MDILAALYEHRDELAAGFGALVLASTAFVAAAHAFLAAVRKAAVWLVGIAARTRSTRDDEAAARLLSAIDVALSVLDRVSGGLGALTRLLRPVSLAPAVPTRDGRTSSPGASATLGALLAVAVGLSGCGASWIDVAHDTTAGGALAVTAVDPILADRYDALTLDCDRGLLDEATCTERLRRLDRAERSLRSLASALTAVDLALGAYEDGRECGLRPALEGAARSARELVVVLDAAGIDVPPLVLTVANIAVTVADVPECDPGAEDVETARMIVSGGWL